MKSQSQRMEQGSRRKAALQQNLIWRKPTSKHGNKKKRNNKRACRVKISPTTE